MTKKEIVYRSLRSIWADRANSVSFQGVELSAAKGSPHPIQSTQEYKSNRWRQNIVKAPVLINSGAFHLFSIQDCFDTLIIRVPDLF